MIPFLDLASDFSEVEGEARRRIDGVLARQQFVLGPETAGLEAALAERLGCGAAVAVSSGTEALSLALLALGIGAGDAVLLPSFTFFATAGAVARAGAQPVFCDIDAASFLGEAAQMRDAITRQFHQRAGQWSHRTSGARLAALLPVHLYGRACAMDAMVALARELQLFVIEDAAQAIDCRVDGRAVGRWGDVGCFSFYPTKNLGGPGDGGLVLCEDPQFGARLARLRTHGGQPGSYEHSEVGINARISELVAAVVHAKLARLDAWTERRREVARQYSAALGSLTEREGVVLPSAASPESHVWHQYSIRIPGDGKRDRVMQRLEAKGISTRVFYPLPLHQQPCFAALDGRAGDFPESESAAGEVLCLPIYPSLPDSAVERVAVELAAALSEAGA